MIYKYEIPVQSTFELVLPRPSIILSVQEQNGKICLWALVDSNTKETEIRRIHIVGTGYKFPLTSLQFIATVQLGVYVWHIFEEIK
jgi:hypothetical protein